MIVSLQILIIHLGGNALVSALNSAKSLSLIDEMPVRQLDADGSSRLAGSDPGLAVGDLADASRYQVSKLPSEKLSNGVAAEEEPLWVPWWIPQVSTHFTFFRACMAGLFAILVFATAAFLTGYTPSKLSHKRVFEAVSLWKRAPPSPEPAAPALPSVPETLNADDLESELLQRACFAEAIAKKQVSRFFDAKESAKRKTRQPMPQEDLDSSDDEDIQDPDPPLCPGAEAPFMLLFGAEGAEVAKSQDHVPFAFLMANENPRPMVDSIRAPLEATARKTVISAKKFEHALMKEAKTQGLSRSSSS